MCYDCSLLSIAKEKIAEKRRKVGVCVAETLDIVINSKISSAKFIKNGGEIVKVYVLLKF